MKTLERYIGRMMLMSDRRQHGNIKAHVKAKGRGLRDAIKRA
jgi:hypothetical protein